ncbi:L-aspartate oxidase [Clostridium sediminicola]|uniref:L-aspartate oxidase n=1 Tax=Clostridium sediminicola TaxID=3114879 RepID=UPI0031F1F501
MKISTDVLIVGSGLAGLYAALHLKEDLNVTIVTKSTADNCNTYLAQGGISTVLNDEDESLFVEDTLRAGSYKNDINAVRILATDTRPNIEFVENIGVDFDKNDSGYNYTREGAHSVNRIVHYKDYTGKQVFECLYKEVINRKNINIIENCCIVDLLKDSNNAIGAIGLIDDEVITFNSKITILATGGIGGLFKNSTNQRGVAAEGIAIAIRNGIKVKNLNFVQFHPTALYEEENNDRRFLISESVRGEGGILVNKYGNRFVNELLSRDVVSREIIKEEKKTEWPCVYLDISNMTSDYIIDRFPSIYKGCYERGIDITKEKIPVTSVQHYFMGGIDVDFNCKTSMNNLFACGEVSCTGVHGSNRLASNSLLEALVFSRRAANYINDTISKTSIMSFESDLAKSKVNKILDLNRKVAVYEFSKVLGDKKNELASC